MGLDRAGKETGGRVQYNIGGVTCNHPLCGREWETEWEEKEGTAGLMLCLPCSLPRIYTRCNASFVQFR